MLKTCRFCGKALTHVFVELKVSPLSNSYVTPDDADKAEMFYPLSAFVCDRCFLVQVLPQETPETIFREYYYFSSYSASWLEHCSRYVEHIIKEYHVCEKSQVVELASNDGYLLQFFKEKGIPTLGIDPARNIAAIAEKRGIKTIAEFFGAELAKKLRDDGIRADLLIGNNVLAHVPDINDFVAGIHILLSEKGVATLEFPHLMELVRHAQFDTIYHEHFSYFSLHTARRIFEARDLEIFDVEKLQTHGGSLRIYVRHKSPERTGEDSENVVGLLKEEKSEGMDDIAYYTAFNEKVQETKRSILDLLIRLKGQGASIAAYGAPAKGNTLLNYCGIGTDLIAYTVDKNPHKQNALLPGSRIPVFDVSRIKQTKPDYLVILPWNIKEEIMEQCGYIKSWGGKFVVLIPKAEIL